jgi:hypothetical protein
MNSGGDTQGLLEWVSPFGDLRVNGHLRLTEAYRSLSRPSSPADAKASPVCPCLLPITPSVSGVHVADFHPDVPPVPTPGAENGPAVFHSEKLLESSLARCSGEDACISQGIWFDLERTLTARWRENSSTKKRAGRRTNGFSAKTALRSGCTQLRLATRGVSGCQLPRMLLRSSLERR